MRNELRPTFQHGDPATQTSWKQRGFPTWLLCLVIGFGMILGVVGDHAWATSPQSKTSTSSDSLKSLFRDYHEQYLVLFPIEATNFGDYRYNDLLPIDISPDFLKREKQFYESILHRLASVDLTTCSDIEKLMAEILRYELEMRLASMEFRNERIPLHQFDGLHLAFAQMGSGSGSQPFKTVKDYEAWMKRIDGFCNWMRAAREQMREGIGTQYVLPKSLVEKMIPQFLDPTILTDSLEKNVYGGPLKTFPESFSSEDKNRLTDLLGKAIRSELIPTYREFGEFLKTEYLPASRASSGISALSGGSEQYRFWVRYWTTTDLTPDAIFELGEKEVARILDEMTKVQSQMGIQGSRNDFFRHLRSHPDLMPYNDAKEVIADFVAIQSKIEPQLDRYFLKRPKTAFEIRRTESFRENTASAEYMPGTPDGRRPGIFYVPIPDAKSFNVTSGMESLFLHEAIPGHHYQVSLQQENNALPDFARFLWYGAYGEGWALYCETLGPELGLYTDPRQKMGALGDEMHRAIRLVVDVGIHAKGWTRERAIEYMMANEAISEQGAVAEIERYMAMPGQALAYKIGQLKLTELRARYQKQLGTRFRLAEFHDQILKDGGMPLSILERRLDDWAQKQVSSTVDAPSK